MIFYRGRILQITANPHIISTPLPQPRTVPTLRPSGRDGKARSRQSPRQRWKSSFACTASSSLRTLAAHRMHALTTSRALVSQNHHRPARSRPPPRRSDVFDRVPCALARLLARRHGMEPQPPGHALPGGALGPFARLTQAAQEPEASRAAARQAADGSPLARGEVPAPHVDATTLLRMTPPYMGVL